MSSNRERFLDMGEVAEPQLSVVTRHAEAETELEITEEEKEEEIVIETTEETEIEKEKEKERERERQRQREESGDFGPIIIQCDICHDHSWRIRKSYMDGEWVMADLDCVNGREGAIGIKEEINENEPARISSERPDVSSDIEITCGHCGHTNMFKTHGWFKVLHPGGGVKTVRVECSCGKIYILKTFDSHQKK